MEEGGCVFSASWKLLHPYGVKAEEDYLRLHYGRWQMCAFFRLMKTIAPKLGEGRSGGRGSELRKAHQMKELPLSAISAPQLQRKRVDALPCPIPFHLFLSPLLCPSSLASPLLSLSRASLPFLPPYFPFPSHPPTPSPLSPLLPVLAFPSLPFAFRLDTEELASTGASREGSPCTISGEETENGSLNWIQEFVVESFGILSRLVAVLGHRFFTTGLDLPLRLRRSFPPGTPTRVGRTASFGDLRKYKTSLESSSPPIIHHPGAPLPFLR